MINWKNKKMHSDISESVIQIPLPLCVNLARAKIQMISAENVRKGPRTNWVHKPESEAAL